MKYKCLSIAGFDGSGGAGLQADLKTFSALGCYGMTVLTALPVQNTCGVRSCYSIPLISVQEQLEAIFDDIIPDSIKIGMLFTQEIIELVAKFLEKKTHLNIPIVLDPVMQAKSGDPLLQPDAIEIFKKRMIPLASVITPNLPEARLLVGKSEEGEKLANSVLNLGAKAVLLKGGHGTDSFSNDFYIDHEGSKVWLNARRIPSKNTHGTGCTLSAAICSFLARGSSIIEACQAAKLYLTEALEAAKESSVGHGHGPVHHFYAHW